MIYMFFSLSVKEVKFLTFDIAGDSQIFVHQPWINTLDGYVTTLSGNLYNLSVYTSLEYHNLAKIEEVQVQIP